MGLLDGNVFVAAIAVVLLSFGLYSSGFSWVCLPCFLARGCLTDLEDPLLSYAKWTVSSWDPPISDLWGWGYTTMLGFYVGTGDLNSGLNTYKTLRHLPSPSFSLFYFAKLKVFNRFFLPLSMYQKYFSCIFLEIHLLMITDYYNSFNSFLLW